MAKERERIDRLQRRLEYLEGVIDAPGSAVVAGLAYDVAEASALRWVIALAELALSNWPAGIQSVRETEESRWTVNV